MRHRSPPSVPHERGAGGKPAPYELNLCGPGNDGPSASSLAAVSLARGRCSRPRHTHKDLTVNGIKSKTFIMQLLRSRQKSKLGIFCVTPTIKVEIFSFSFYFFE